MPQLFSDCDYPSCICTYPECLPRSERFGLPDDEDNDQPAYAWSHVCSGFSCTRCYGDDL